MMLGNAEADGSAAAKDGAPFGTSEFWLALFSLVVVVAAFGAALRTPSQSAPCTQGATAGSQKH